MSQSSPEANIHMEGQKLLDAIKQSLPLLQTLLQPRSRHSPGEDEFYRFYHQSFKVYGLQSKTTQIVQAFEEIGQKAGLENLNPLFLQIIKEGTGLQFHFSHNQNWAKHTRPILEAYFHAREMLDLMIKYGNQLELAPNSLPSGWGAILYLYQIR
jgi:hypothetical protein